MNNSPNPEPNQVVETAERGNNDFSWNLINLLNVTNAMKGSRRRNI